MNKKEQSVAGLLFVGLQLPRTGINSKFPGFQAADQNAKRSACQDPAWLGAILGKWIAAVPVNFTVKREGNGRIILPLL